MNFDFKSQGWNHVFRMDRNELIIRCYDSNGYRIGNIRLIINVDEKNELIKILKESKP